MPCVNIYSIWWYGWKPSVSAFQNFLWIDNQLNIKKVMGRNVWMCFVSTALTYIALNALEILMPYVDSVDIYSIWGYCIQSRVEFSNLITLYIVLCKSHKHQFDSVDKQQHTQYTIALLWSFVLTISTLPLMYTQQIRWQWVASSLSNSK